MSEKFKLISDFPRYPLHYLVCLWLEITRSLKNVTVMKYLRHYVLGNYPLKRDAPLQKK